MWQMRLATGHRSQRGRPPYEAIGVMAAEGGPVQAATRVLHVAESGYYAWKNRPPSARSVKHAWPAKAITGIHTASRGTYGARRVPAELGLGSGIHVSHGTVESPMQRTGLQGLPGNHTHRSKHQTPSATDLIERNFTRSARDQLWVADFERREALLNRVEVRDHHRRPVAAGW